MLGNQMLYRTLSCRTGRLTRPVDPVRVLLLVLLTGTGFGALLIRYVPEAAQMPLLTQGLAASDGLRTLWDVFCTAAVPMCVLLGVTLLLGGWGWGQPFLAALMLSRGIAAGLAVSDCFLRFGLRTGICTADTVILPYALLSVILLVYPVKEALTLSCRITVYLVRGNADPEIGAKQHKLLMAVLRSLLLTAPAAGLHTLLVFATDRIF